MLGRGLADVCMDTGYRLHFYIVYAHAEQQQDGEAPTLCLTYLWFVGLGAYPEFLIL